MCNKTSHNLLHVRPLGGPGGTTLGVADLLGRG